MHVKNPAQTIYAYALSTTLEARTLTITPPMQLLPNRKITKPAILGSCTLKLRALPSCKYQLHSLSENETIKQFI
jgi:hypothetical protein